MLDVSSTPRVNPLEIQDLLKTYFNGSSPLKFSYQQESGALFLYFRGTSNLNLLETATKLVGNHGIQKTHSFFEDDISTHYRTQLNGDNFNLANETFFRLRRNQKAVTRSATSHEAKSRAHAYYKPGRQLDSKLLFQAVDTTIPFGAIYFGAKILAIKSTNGFSHSLTLRVPAYQENKLLFDNWAKIIEDKFQILLILRDENLSRLVDHKMSLLADEKFMVYEPSCVRKAIALIHGIQPPKVEIPDITKIVCRDLTDKKFITIDHSFNVIDKEDAFCLEDLPGGGRKVIISTTDVSWVFKIQDPIFDYAKQAGTTYYSSSMTIPILGEEITRATSFDKGEIRISWCAEVVFDSKNKLISKSHFLGKVSTSAEYDYSTADQIFKNPDSPEYQYFANLLIASNALANLMSAGKFKVTKSSSSPAQEVVSNLNSYAKRYFASYLASQGPVIQRVQGLTKNWMKLLKFKINATFRQCLKSEELELVLRKEIAQKLKKDNVYPVKLKQLTQPKVIMGILKNLLELGYEDLAHEIITMHHDKSRLSLNPLGNNASQSEYYADIKGRSLSGIVNQFLLRGLLSKEINFSRSELKKLTDQANLSESVTQEKYVQLNMLEYHRHWLGMVGQTLDCQVVRKTPRRNYVKVVGMRSWGLLHSDPKTLASLEVGDIVRGKLTGYHVKARAYLLGLNKQP